jgi:hypothetical protein
MVADWLEGMRGEPLAWLLDDAVPAVRHLALRDLLDRPPEDPELRAAQDGAMHTDPIVSILAAQDPAGWWVKPGPGYGPKYRGTVWSLMFLDQLGADPRHPKVAAACEYVLTYAQAASGGFAASGQKAETPPPPSLVVHCLTGNLLAALIGLGWLDDTRVAHALEWQVHAVTGEGGPRFNALVPGPGFRCGANDGLPCAWGAVKVVLALARVPAGRRAPSLQRALDAGVAFLLGHDPAVADYPMGFGNTRPSGSWFRLGFPSGYVADVLQVLEALCAAGAAGDPRLGHAVTWLLSQQDEAGRWANRSPYAGKLVRDIDVPGEPSRWVTLRACRVLKAVAQARTSPGLA